MFLDALVWLHVRIVQLWGLHGMYRILTMEALPNREGVLMVDSVRAFQDIKVLFVLGMK